ncbi:MAG: hypothetical protein QOI38_2858 [Sphingomonadales bacterium]|nr:hypothetical protein [Sphingomonadales bacterium]
MITQIIMDEEQRGATMLPVNFLRQLIGLYGNSMQAAVPQYLEASLEAFQHNHSQMREAMAGAFSVNPFAEIARRNMEMFAAAAGGVGGAAPSREETTATDAQKRELAELRAQLAELQKKLEKLGG